MNQRILLGIIIGAGLFSVGISYGTLTQGSVDSFDRSVKLADGVPLQWNNNATSIANTNYFGNATGPYITERAFSGTIFKTGGNANYATGTENARIDSRGIQMANGNSFYWQDLAISISRTDTTGALQGNIMTLRGYDGIVFKTLGTASYGTGNEAMRITPQGNVGIGTNAPTQKLSVSGNILLTGNLTATPTNILAIKTTNNKDICIGTGC